jgi:hypothetical protein
MIIFESLWSENDWAAWKNGSGCETDQIDEIGNNKIHKTKILTDPLVNVCIRFGVSDYRKYFTYRTVCTNGFWKLDFFHSKIFKQCSVSCQMTISVILPTN